MKFRLVEALHNLTREQEQYFKNSKFKGIPFYHGSGAKDISVFRCDTEPCFFSMSKDYSTEMVNPDYEPEIYEVYLNITKPFDLSSEEQINIFNDKYIPWVQTKNVPFEAKNKSLGEPLDLNNADYIYKFLKENNYDFDGLIVDEGIPNTEFYKKYAGIKSYVPFNANQIKSVDNLNPTKDKNIHK